MEPICFTLDFLTIVLLYFCVLDIENYVHTIDGIAWDSTSLLDTNPAMCNVRAACLHIATITTIKDENESTAKSLMIFITLVMVMFSI